MLWALLAGSSLGTVELEGQLNLRCEIAGTKFADVCVQQRYSTQADEFNSRRLFRCPGLRPGLCFCVRASFSSELSI